MLLIVKSGKKLVGARGKEKGKKNKLFYYYKFEYDLYDASPANGGTKTKIPKGNGSRRMYVQLSLS